MKPVFCLLLTLALPMTAWGDVQVRYKDMTGATNTARSNGHKVRIDNENVPGYILVDSVIDTFYMIDTQNEQIMKMSLEEMGSGAMGKPMNVSLKARGKGDKIAGYRTGRFDLIADGLGCGSLNGSSELAKNRELRQMLEAMENMAKMSRMRMAQFGNALSECQQASSQMSDLLDTSGFVMRYIDDQGQILFEVLSVETGKEVSSEYYDLPSGMEVVDMDEQMGQAAKQSEKIQQQMPELGEMMKQIQEDGKLDEDAQDQLKKMFESLQSQ